MTHVVLTGASGFVGSHVLRHLLTETDWTIGCPVSFRHAGIPPRIETQLEGHPEWWSRVAVVRSDLAAPMDTVTAERIGLFGAEYIFNLASESHVDRSIADPRPFIENNVSVVLNVLEAARAARGLKAFFQMSTDEVYGPAPDGADSNEWDPIEPSNPYSASKACQEAIAFSFWRTYGIPLVITNTMNIIGELQDPEKFVPMTIARVASGQIVDLHASPDGVPGSRFYLHARNLADGLLFLAKTVEYMGQGWIEDARGATEALRWSHDADRPIRVNIAGEREVDNLEMAQLVAKTVGKQLDHRLIDFHSSRPGHDLRYALTRDRLEGLGWQPPLSLERSLEQTVRWTLEHPEWLRLSQNLLASQSPEMVD